MFLHSNASGLHSSVISSEEFILNVLFYIYLQQQQK